MFSGSKATRLTVFSSTIFERATLLALDRWVAAPLTEAFWLCSWPDASGDAFCYLFTVALLSRAFFGYVSEVAALSAAAVPD